MTPQKTLLAAALALSVTACADMQSLVQKMKQPSNAHQTSVSDPNLTAETPAATAPLDSSNNSFFTSVKQAFLDEGTINLSALSSLEQTSECKSLVTEMNTGDSLGKIVGMTLRLFLTNKMEELSLSLQGSSKDPTRAARIEQRDKVIMGLFAKGLVWLPMEVEKMQGDSYQEANKPHVLERDSKVGRQLYPKADAMLAKLTANLPANLPYDFQNNLFVLKTNGKNAKAVQGGAIYLDKDALDKGFEDRAYFALAHEISHLLQRHETKHTQARILDTVTTLANLPKALTTYGGLGKVSSSLSTAFVVKGLYDKHHSGQEIGGDSCAIKIMDTAELPKKQIHSAVSQFIKSLPPSQFTKPEAPGSTFTTDVIGLLKPSETHPTSEERIANLRRQMLALK
jgi:Zn-dependent protease with chaperone function